MASARIAAVAAIPRALNLTPALTAPPTRTFTHPHTTRRYAWYAQRHAISGKKHKNSGQAYGPGRQFGYPRGLDRAQKDIRRQRALRAEHSGHRPRTKTPRNGAKRLKYEFRRLGETRQRGGRGIEYWTAADIAVGAAIK